MTGYAKNSEKDGESSAIVDAITQKLLLGFCSSFEAGHA
jgi:hypothetical protein